MRRIWSGLVEWRLARTRDRMGAELRFLRRSSQAVVLNVGLLNRRHERFDVCCAEWARKERRRIIKSRLRQLRRRLGIPP